MIYAENDLDVGHYKGDVFVEYDYHNKMEFDAPVFGAVDSFGASTMAENIIKRVQGTKVPFKSTFLNGTSGIIVESDGIPMFAMKSKDPYYQWWTSVDPGKLVRVHAERTQDIRELAVGVGTIALCGTAIACVSHNIPSRIGYPTCLAVGAVSAFVSAWFTRNK